MNDRSPSSALEAPIESNLPAITGVPSSNGPHELECLIQRGLTAHPGLKFSRLTVHQCPQGVCLEGSLEANDEGIDLCDLVNQIAGVKAINRVVTQPAKPC